MSRPQCDVETSATILDEKRSFTTLSNEFSHASKDGVGSITVDDHPEELSKTRRKIDLVIMPLLGFCYMLQFLDKLSLNYASLLGIVQDLNLIGSQYSWASSVFYFGYLFWSYPTSYLVVRLPIGKYLSASVLLWAVVLMCHAACNNFTSLMIARFFLGATEAAVAPGFSLFTGIWYTRKEQPLRHGIWFCGNSIASIVGGVASYGIGHLDGKLAAWQNLFLIFGAVTAVWAIIMFILLPDGQDQTWWLTKEERKIASLRVAGNQTGDQSNRQYKLRQFADAVTDPANWLLALYILCVNLANGGLTAFGSLVVKGFGYQGLDALLLQMPAGATQLGFVILGCYLSSRFPNIRILIMFFLTLVSVLGLALMYALEPSNRSGRLAGYCLAMGYAANMPLGLSLISSNVAGFTKKATFNACTFIAYCVGNIVGPQFYSIGEAPKYQRGIAASLAGLCLGACFILCLRVWYSLQNSGKDRKYRQVGDTVITINQDLTDRENKNFRYIL